MRGQIARGAKTKRDRIWATRGIIDRGTKIKKRENLVNDGEIREAQKI